MTIIMQQSWHTNADSLYRCALVNTKHNDKHGLPINKTSMCLQLHLMYITAHSFIQLEYTRASQHHSGGQVPCAQTLLVRGQALAVLFMPFFFFSAVLNHQILSLEQGQCAQEFTATSADGTKGFVGMPQHENGLNTQWEQTPGTMPKQQGRLGFIHSVCNTLTDTTGFNTVPVFKPAHTITKLTSYTEIS